LKSIYCHAPAFAAVLLFISSVFFAKLDIVPDESEKHPGHDSDILSISNRYRFKDYLLVNTVFPSVHHCSDVKIRG
jgi:hypothetical protein